MEKYLNWADLRDNGYIQTTGNGKIVNIQIRVYPEGFGQVIVRRNESPIQPVELMCNHFDDAEVYLKEIWQCLQQTPDVNSK